MVAAVTHDRWPVHVRLLAGEFVHQLHQRAAVVTHFLLRLLVDEGIDVGGGGVGLVGFGHGSRSEDSHRASYLKRKVPHAQLTRRPYHTLHPKVAFYIRPNWFSRTRPF